MNLFMLPGSGIITTTDMRYIRSPWWDGIFILSGLPIGLGLLGLTGPWYDWTPYSRHYASSTALLMAFWVVPFLEIGHSLSPIVLAWLNAGFRRRMLERKGKYIVLPSAIFVLYLAVGVAAGSGLTAFVYRPLGMYAVDQRLEPVWQEVSLANPLPIVVWVYVVWNAYHFAMQNFGVLSLYRSKIANPSPIGRSIDKWFCLAVTCPAMAVGFPISWVHLPRAAYFCIMVSLSATTAMLIREASVYRSFPRSVLILTDGLTLALIWWQPIIGTGVYSINHWLVAIGLASKEAPIRWWLFALGLVVAGGVGLVFLTPTSLGIRLGIGFLLRWSGPMPYNTMTIVFPIIVCARLANGIVHFLYDKWVWSSKGRALLRET
jgi:hypothetical protein